jgi:hypothetical protein
MVTKNSVFFVPNDYSYGQLANIQKFYLSLRLWSNRERLLAFQLLNSWESKFVNICGDKCLEIIISVLELNQRSNRTGWPDDLSEAMTQSLTESMSLSDSDNVDLHASPSQFI